MSTTGYTKMINRLIYLKVLNFSTFFGKVITSKKKSNSKTLK